MLAGTIPNVYNLPTIYIKAGVVIMGEKVIRPDFSFGVQTNDMRFLQEQEECRNSNIFSATVAGWSSHQSRR